MQAEITKQFVEAVEKYGAKTAVVDYPDGKRQRRTSFDELMKRARQVAAYIHRKGIASHSFVTIELPAGADFLAAEMGVWLACCVAVPVGPSFPGITGTGAFIQYGLMFMKVQAKMWQIQPVVR